LVAHGVERLGILVPGAFEVPFLEGNRGVVHNYIRFVRVALVQVAFARGKLVLLVFNDGLEHQDALGVLLSLHTNCGANGVWIQSCLVERLSIIELVFLNVRANSNQLFV